MTWDTKDGAGQVSISMVPDAISLIYALVNTGNQDVAIDEDEGEH